MRCDLRETVDDVEEHLLASVDDRETEVDEMSCPVQKDNKQLAGRRRERPDRAEIKSRDFTIEDWSVLPIVIGDSGDVDRSSLCESAFFLSKRDVLPLKEIQGIASALNCPIAQG